LIFLLKKKLFKEQSTNNITNK